MISRQNPSLSKVQYLLHMQECHSLAAGACRENARVISRLFLPLPMPLHMHVKSHVLLKSIDDFNYLAGEFDKHAAQIVELKQSITEQIELFDKRRNRVIGLFVAIYVPLAFTTVWQPRWSLLAAMLTCTVILWDEHRRRLRFRVLVQRHDR